MQMLTPGSQSVNRSININSRLPEGEPENTNVNSNSLEREVEYKHQFLVPGARTKIQMPTPNSQSVN
jgi:hypothetical protein